MLQYFKWWLGMHTLHEAWADFRVPLSKLTCSSRRSDLPSAASPRLFFFPLSFFSCDVLLLETGSRVPDYSTAIFGITRIPPHSTQPRFRDLLRFTPAAVRASAAAVNILLLRDPENNASTPLRLVVTHAQTFVWFHSSNQQTYCTQDCTLSAALHTQKRYQTLSPNEKKKRRNNSK